MRATRQVLYDSFRAARGELSHIFAAMKSEEHLRRAVQQYIRPSASRQRARSAGGQLSRAQARSLFRTSASLILQEARRRGDSRVAAVALDVALAEAQLSDVAQQLEPAWVKDAVASCRSAAELRMMEDVLRRHERRLVASGSAMTTANYLLTSVLGRSRATESGLRVGDDDNSDDTAAAVGTEEEDGGGGSRALSSQGTGAAPVGAGTAAVDAHDHDSHAAAQARLSLALTQPPSLADLATTGGSAGAVHQLPPAERTAAVVDRLHRLQRNASAGPNVSFTRWFMRQGLVRDEAELMALYMAMRARPLDVGFRVLGSSGEEDAGRVPCSASPHASAVHAILQHRRGIHRVSWLPAAMGVYTLDTRDGLPPDAVLANRGLLRSLARERLIVFQSLSSMLPVYFMDPQPGDCVLDLCAAPGNKTGLVLDCMRAGGGGGGCVVANEAQASRVRDLQERLRDASPDVVVTRGRGQEFGVADRHGGDHDGVTLLGEGLYDRVLVDAPCSGEGRMGRDALSWRLWHPGRGSEFHPTQCALLHRALRLCKVGGRVVYATCTLNPLENEAVVAAVLRGCGGAVELVPPPLRLPSAAAESDGVPPLRLTPGLRRWDVPSSAGGYLRSAAEAYAQGESAARLPPDLFADDDADRGAALQRCCRRVMPHLNGGADGFFIAVLERRAAVPSQWRAAPGPAHASELPPPTPASPTAAASVTVVPTPTPAASLAVSLAGGSNLLSDRGLVRLPPSHHLVQRHIGSFFTRARAPPSPARPGQCSSAQEFLETHGWSALWCEREGLRLLSRTAELMLRRHSTMPVAPPPRAPANGFGLGFSRRHRPEDAHETSLAPPSAGAELLDAGVLVVDAQGGLTERGAALLRHSATSRLLSLPLPYAQLLLARRTLDVGAALALMPAYVQEAEEALQPRRGLLPPPAPAASARERAGRNAAASEAHETTWYREALAALTPAVGDVGEAAGNAIVVVRASSTWAAPLSSWAWPVRVEVLQPWSALDTDAAPRGLARLHLTLPTAARHRTQALVGRLQGAAHRSGDAQARQQEVLRASARYDPSLTMGAAALTGVAASAHPQQHHRRLSNRTAPTPTSCAPRPSTAAAADTTAAAPPTSPDVFEL
ncbi:NOL1/NOP2/sun family [Novymonas esmeraldas]|uniref:NOL1/NOP2/sun family n=1 Tax=Novymonas esmeraldas TaxID=1808958 RepID=A0AAW0ETD0_9TRYP